VPPIDAALVATLVASQFPAWSGRPIQPIVPGGWDNRSFRLGDDLLVRLPSAQRYVAQVGKEQDWLPRLAPALPLPIPEPVAAGRPGAGYPWPWSVYRWIDGTPLAAVAAADVDLVRLADDLAAVLAALRVADTAGAPAAGADTFHRGGDLAVYDGETRAAVAALGTEIDGAAATAVWDAALATRWHRPPVWVHGDVAAGNLLLRDGRLAAVIDFGSAAVGDPACDLAIAWTVFAGASRRRFRDAATLGTAPLDAATWARARGWALWKALITCAGRNDGAAPAAARRVVAAVLADPVVPA
jgi:aminoglycoside phosphotransferase (APT) family kinase protein